MLTSLCSVCVGVYQYSGSMYTQNFGYREATNKQLAYNVYLIRLRLYLPTGPIASRYQVGILKALHIYRPSQKEERGPNVTFSISR
jgi:hypothetical protein